MFDLDNEIINNVRGSWAAGEQGVLQVMKM